MTSQARRASAATDLDLRMSRGVPNAPEDGRTTEILPEDAVLVFGERSVRQLAQPGFRAAPVDLDNQKPVFGLSADGADVKCPSCASIISIVNSRYCWQCGAKLIAAEYVSLVRPLVATDKDELRPVSAPVPPSRVLVDAPIPKFQRDVANNARVFAKSKSDLGASSATNHLAAEFAIGIGALNMKRKTSLDLSGLSRGSGSRSSSSAVSSVSGSPTSASSLRGVAVSNIGPSRLFDDGTTIIRDEKDLPQIPPSNVKEAIFQAQSAYWSDSNRYTIYEILLDNLMDLTESCYGYAGYVKVKDGKQRVKVRIVMSRSPDGVKSKEETHCLISKPDHICSVVIQSRQVVMSNSPDDDFPVKTVAVPNTRECPAFRSCMALPIFTGARETLLAVMVLFNRPFGYGVHHVVTVQPYIKTCANLLEAHINHNIVKTQSLRGYKRAGKKASYDGDEGSDVPPSSELLQRRRFTEPASLTVIAGPASASELRSGSDLGPPPMGSMGSADPSSFVIRRVRKTSGALLGASTALRESVPDLGRRFSESVVDHQRPLTMSAPAVGGLDLRRDPSDPPAAPMPASPAGSSLNPWGARRPSIDIEALNASKEGSDDVPVLLAPKTPPKSQGRRRSISHSPKSVKEMFGSLFKGKSQGDRESQPSPPPVPTKPATKREGEYAMLLQAATNKDFKDLKSVRRIVHNDRKILDMINEQDDEGRTLLHLAVKAESYDFVDLLIDVYQEHTEANPCLRDSSGCTALHLACCSGNTRTILSLLLLEQIDTNIEDQSGFNAFHHFCQFYASPSSLRKIFDAFIARKADINSQSSITGETPLHKAVHNTSVRMLLIELLLEHKADLALPDKRGDTPLHVAVRTNRLDLIEKLLVSGADLSINNEDGQTPFDVAVETNAPDGITKFLDKACGLRGFFLAKGMPEYVPIFIQEKMFMDVMHMIDRESVLSELGITKQGDRIRLLAACAELRQRKEASEKKELTSSSSSVSTPGGRQQRQRPLRRGSTKPTQQLIPLRRMSAMGEVEDGLSELDLKTQSGIDEWIQYSEFEFVKQLSSGSSGQVFQGIYRGLSVAIKVLESVMRTDDFKHEVRVLGQVRGPHIVKFVGACVEPRLCMVMEYCRRGSVYDVLCDPTLYFGWEELFSFATQMAKAIHCLHSQDPIVLHRDIKSMNFLVDDNWQVKVCDFGLARQAIKTNMSTLVKLRGTLVFSSPETCQGLMYSAKSDIYSLGICLWEMLHRCVVGSHQVPYAEFEMENQIQIILKVPTGLRPTIPAACPPQVAAMVTECWDSNPDNRPDCERLMAMVAGCVEDMAENRDLYAASSGVRPRPMRLSLDDGVPIGSNPGTPLSGSSGSNSPIAPRFPPSMHHPELERLSDTVRHLDSVLSASAERHT